MALKIGDKIFRNLPEQVAKNQSDIQQINGYLDEPIKNVQIIDGHLIVTTARDQEIDAGELLAITSIYMENSHLKVNLNDGTTEDLGLVKGISNVAIDASQHLIITYSDGSSADAGNLADFSDADFLAKTLLQAEANWSANVVPSTPQLGLDISTIFSNISQFNRKLNIITILKAENNTANTITVYQIGAGVISLTPELAEKIYDYDGNTARSTTSNALISGTMAYVNKAGLIIYDSAFSIYNRLNENDMVAYFNRATGFQLAPGESMTFEARVELVI